MSINLQFVLNARVKKIPHEKALIKRNDEATFEYFNIFPPIL